MGSHTVSHDYSKLSFSRQITERRSKILKKILALLTSWIVGEWQITYCLWQACAGLGQIKIFKAQSYLVLLNVKFLLMCQLSWRWVTRARIGCPTSWFSQEWRVFWVLKTWKISGKQGQSWSYSKQKLTKVRVCLWKVCTPCKGVWHCPCGKGGPPPWQSWK